jgi:transcription termination factor NusB
LKIMVLGAIGSILGAAGSVASGIMSSINNRKALQAQQAEAARQQAYYEAKANEDPLSKASNRRLLNEYDRKSQKQLQAAQGVAAITGATPEYTLAVQKGIAEGRADLMGNISANQESTAEKALEQAELARQQAALAEQQRLAARDQAYANLAANAASAAGSMISGMQPRSNAASEVDTSVLDSSRGVLKNNAKIATSTPAATISAEELADAKRRVLG